VTVAAPDAAIMEWFETAFVKMMAQVDILLVIAPCLYSAVLCKLRCGDPPECTPGCVTLAWCCLSKLRDAAGLVDLHMCSMCCISCKMAHLAPGPLISNGPPTPTSCLVTVFYVVANGHWP
jgi:hypothetical protein